MRLTLIIFLFPLIASAQQDLIIKTNGDSIRCKITAISEGFIAYIDSTGRHAYQLSFDSVRYHSLAYYYNFADAGIASIPAIKNPDLKIANQRTLGSAMIAAGGVLMLIQAVYNSGGNPWSAGASRFVNGASGALIGSGAIVIGSTWHHDLRLNYKEQ